MSLSVFISLPPPFYLHPSLSQVLGDAVTSREDDRIKAVDVQLGKIVHLHRSLSVTEARGLHHHVPERWGQKTLKHF